MTRALAWLTNGSGAAHDWPTDDRFRAAGWTVDTAAARPTSAQLAGYDALILDSGYWGLGTDDLLLAQDAYARGINVFTTGNDTGSGQIPFLTSHASFSSDSQLNPIVPATVAHPAAQGWTSFNDSDARIYFTGVSESATVLGYGTRADTGALVPMIIADVHSSGARWIHCQPYNGAHPADLIPAFARWLEGTGRGDFNLLDTSSWSLGSGSVPGFPVNGATTENYRVLDDGPLGRETVVWESRSDTASDADGGWNADFKTTDPSKTYRFSVWLRRTVTGNGTAYLGTNGGGAAVLTSAGDANSNPYFWYSSNLGVPEGEWILVVGHVQAHDAAKVVHPDTGVYDEAGNKVAGASDFWNAPTTTSLRHRSYLYYSTDVNTRQQFAHPRMEVVDGTEPTLAELLSNPPQADYTYGVLLSRQPAYADLAARYPTYGSIPDTFNDETSSVTGAGDSVATTTTERRGAGNVTTGGLITAVGRQETSRTVSLSTGGTITAVGRQETSRSVVLSAGGDAVATAQPTKSSSAPVTGAGDAAATTSTTRMDSQSISAGGAVTAEVQEVALATSSVTGGGATAAAGDKTTTATRTVTGGGDAPTSATTTRDGTAGISGSGLAEATALRLHDRAVSLTTGGSVVATPGVPERGVAAEVTAVARTAISATTTRDGTAGISGTGATVPAWTRETEQTGAVTGAEVVAAEGTTDRTSPALSSTTAATTTTSGLSDRSAASSISGSGTTFTAWYPIASVTSMVTGGGSVATTYWHEILERDGNASVTGAGAVDAAGDTTRLDTGSVAGTGAVEAGGAGDRAGVAQVTGAGSIAAEGRAEAAGAAEVTGAGSLATAAQGEREADSVISTPTSVAATVATSEPGQASVSISGSGTVLTDGNFEISSPVLGMSAAGRVDTSGDKTVRRGVAVVARGRVTTSAQEQNSGTAGVSGGGSIGAAGLKDWATVADVSGLLRLQSTARATRLAERLVSGTGAVVTFWEARLGRWVNYDAAHVTGGGSVSHVGIRIQREWLWAESDELWRESGFDPRLYVQLLRQRSGEHGIYPVPAGSDAVRAMPDYTPVPSASPDDLWAASGGDTALYVRLVREKEFRDSQGVT